MTHISDLDLRHAAMQYGSVYATYTIHYFILGLYILLYVSIVYIDHLQVERIMKV
jgi:hypothetical protein